MYLDLFVSLISLKYNNWDEIKKKKYHFSLGLGNIFLKRYSTK